MFHRRQNDGDLRERPAHVLKGLVRATLVAAVVLALLLAAAAAGFALAFDPNAHRERIAALVHERTGRDLRIDGDVELTLFPWLGVKTGALRLAQPGGFAEGTPPFARVERASASVRLWPLLRGRIEAGTIELDGLALVLERAEDGTTSWDDVLRFAAGDAEAAPAPGGDAGPALLIGALRIRDARVEYTDRAAGRAYRLDAGALTTDTIVPGEPFDLETRFRVESDGVVADVEARGVVTAAGPAATVLVENARATIAFGQGLALPPLTLTADAAIYAGGALEVDAPRVAVDGDVGAGVHARGALEGESLAVSAAGVATLNAPVLALALAGDAVPGGQGELRAQAPAVELDLDAQAFSAADVDGALYGLAFTASARGERLFEAPLVEGAVDVAEFSPKSLSLRLGRSAPATADPAALTRASLHAAYAVDAGGLALTDLNVVVDDTTLTGELRVPDLAQPSARFALAADRIVLDRYVTPVKPAGATVPDLERTLADVLRPLDASGTLAVGALELGGVRFANVALALDAGGDEAAMPAARIGAL
jgi:AsmA protein